MKIVGIKFSKKAITMLFFLHITITIIITCLVLILKTSLPLEFLKILFVIYFIENCITSLTEKFFNLYQIFLGTSFLFVYARIFLDVLGYCDFRELTMYEKGYMSEYDAKLLLITLIVFVAATSLGWLLFLHNNKKKSFDIKSKKYFLQRPYSTIENIIKKAFYILLILSLIRLIFNIRLILRYGYLILFNGTLVNYSIPVILRVQSIIEAYFPCLLYYCRDKKTYKKYCYLFMIYECVRLFTGQRGATFISIILLLWIYSVYFEKIHIRSLIIIFIAALFIIPFIAVFRGGTQGEGSLVYSLLYGQSGSLMVVSGTIRLLDNLKNKYPFVIGYFVDFFTDIFTNYLNRGQNYNRIEYGNYLGDHLMYNLSPTRYLLGNGTGSSIIAEFYELVNGNLVLLFLISFIFMFFVLKISHKMYKNMFYFVSVYFLVFYFIFSPRDSVFKSFSKIMYALMIIFIFRLFEKYKNRKIE